MKKLFISIMMALTVLVGAGALASPVYAQDATDSAKEEVCKGLTGNTKTTGCNSGAAAGNAIERVVRVILNVLSVVAGFVAVIMIIISGLKYITSGGDSANVATAKKTLIYAIVGLVVVAFSQVIVKFVLAKI
jgi:hypothetical protein